MDTLRSEGFDGPLAVVDADPDAPYDRPPLSKQVLAGEWDPSRSALRDADGLSKLNLDWQVPRRATRLHSAERTVVLDDGTTLRYERLLIATGLIPRSLPQAAGLRGVHTLRTLGDALSLRAAFASARQVLVIGGGFLGAECAATARKAGLEVTLAYPESLPLERALGSSVGKRIAALHEAKGVHLLSSVLPEELLHTRGIVQGARLSNGSVVTADVVVLAIGSVPSTAWLESSGLDLRNGVLCNEHGEAAPGIYAAGDVASWFHPLFGRHLRLEHRTNALEQGCVAARNMLGGRHELADTPFAWTDQYELRIRMYGICSANATVELEAVGDTAFLARYVRDGKLVGIAGAGAAGRLRLLQSELDDTLKANARDNRRSSTTPRIDGVHPV